MSIELDSFFSDVWLSLVKHVLNFRLFSFTIEVVLTVDLAIYSDFMTFEVKFGIFQNWYIQTEM